MLLCIESKVELHNSGKILKVNRCIAAVLNHKNYFDMLNAAYMWFFHGHDQVMVNDEYFVAINDLIV